MQKNGIRKRGDNRCFVSIGGVCRLKRAVAVTNLHLQNCGRIRRLYPHMSKPQFPVTEQTLVFQGRYIDIHYPRICIINIIMLRYAFQSRVKIKDNLSLVLSAHIHAQGNRKCGNFLFLCMAHAKRHSNLGILFLQGHCVLFLCIYLQRNKHSQYG